ncbi:O-antigen ligase family protein [Candidatus Sumerlaeota bacterium]|nr:O-antigen ligase family protein [Candidatus Sumerlaeota bacterium]
MIQNQHIHSSPFFRALLGIAVFFLFVLFCILLDISNFFLNYILFLLLAASIFKPFYPLYLLFLLLPFFGNNPGGKHFLFFVDQILLIALLRWLIPLLFAKKIVLRGARFGVWIWLFFIATILCLFPLRLEILNEMRAIGNIKWLLYNVFNAYAVNYFWSLRVPLNLFLSIMFFYHVINNVSEKKQLSNLALCALSGMFLSLAIGILDFHNIIDLTFFRSLNPDIQRFGYKRLMSLFWHSGWFAEYLSLLSPFYLAFLCYRKFKLKLRHILLFTMILYGVVFTYQRAGWISFMSSAVVLLFLCGKTYHYSYRRLLRIFVGLFVLSLGFAMLFLVFFDTDMKMSLVHRLQNIFQYKDRTHIWNQALILYSKKPFLGVGSGNYYLYHRSAFPPDHPFFDYDKVTAHNTYIHLLVERGPFALLFFIVLLGSAFHSLIKSFGRGENNPDRRMIVVALLSSLTAFTVYGIAQYMFYIRIIELIFWFILALSEIVSRAEQDQYQENKRNPYRWHLVVFVAILSVFLCFQPTSRDMFYWNKCEHIDSSFIGSWFDPWDEVTLPCEGDVVETRFFLFHPDVKTNPVHVSLTVNERALATFLTRDFYAHAIAAYVPSSFKRPLRIGLRTDRLVRMNELFPEFKHDRKQFQCVGERNIHCRNLGLEGVGFYPWEETDGRRFRWTYAKRALCEVKVTSPILHLQLAASNPDLSQKPLSVSIGFYNDKNRTISSQVFLLEKQKGDNSSLNAVFDLKDYIGKTVRMEITTDRLFCPLDDDIEDPRTLGIYVSEPFWE